MRPSVPALVLAGLALGPLGTIPVGPASAQEKIAPTRTYSTDRNDGPDFGKTYMPRSKEAPDRAYGTPTFGRKGAVAPEQKGGPTKEEANAPNGPLPNDTVTPTPGAGAGVNADTFGLPDLAPNNEGVPPASPSANTDFFAHTTEFDLPKPGTDADATDTPLYTTGNPASGGTATPGQDSVSGQDSVFGTAALARERNFGTPDPNADQQKPER
ncbi:MAG TPA: hypothetical protein VE690_10620 [Rhodopila sp.]|nr:hypothetical protein [Rhodopila sp.]